MLDRDLAAMYGVNTHALNQAIKCNDKRFPYDFEVRFKEATKRFYPYREDVQRRYPCHPSEQTQLVMCYVVVLY